MKVSCFIFIYAGVEDKMTNQNVLVSDVKGVAMAVAAMKNQSLFSSSVANSMIESGGGGGCNFTIPRSIKLLKVETAEVGGGAARVNAWVDSLRASSPPRVKSTTTNPSPHNQTEDEESSWNVSIGLGIYLSETCSSVSLTII